VLPSHFAGKLVPIQQTNINSTSYVLTPKDVAWPLSVAHIFSELVSFGFDILDCASLERTKEG
jgi:hypothetical protein